MTWICLVLCLVSMIRLNLLLKCILFSSLDSIRFALYLPVMTDFDKHIDEWEIAADRHYTLTSTNVHQATAATTRTIY